MFLIWKGYILKVIFSERLLHIQQLKNCIGSGYIGEFYYLISKYYIYQL